jgi:hypothetical protein
MAAMGDLAFSEAPSDCIDLTEWVIYSFSQKETYSKSSDLWWVNWSCTLDLCWPY